MNTQINTTMSYKEWLLLLLLSVLWGSSFFYIEILLTELSPMVIVLLRLALATIVLWFVCFIKRLTVPRSWSIWLAFLVMGLLNNTLPFSLIVWGQTHITSGLTAILNATTPLFAVLIAGGIGLSDEKLTWLKLTGVLVGFLGVVVMIGPAAIDGIQSGFLGQLAVLGGALSYALAGIYGRRFSAIGIHPIMTATCQISMGTVLLLPVIGCGTWPLMLKVPGYQTILAILALSILSTALAYVLYFRILASSGATNVLLVTFLVPVTAILLGVIVLGEALLLIHMIGMVLITLGLLMIDGRFWRALLMARTK